MSTGRRGRPTREEAARRRALVLAAGQEVLTQRGYAATSMQEVAARAGVSKESLYAWFGSKERLFSDIVAAEGARTVERIDSLTASGGSAPRETLTGFARALLDLLCGEWSVAVNRGAMASPELAGVVLANGRHAVGPVVEALLAGLDDAGVLDVPDPARAFAELYGLVVQDTQIRVLLGEPAPSRAARRAQAERAVELFWRLRAR